MEELESSIVNVFKSEYKPLLRTCSKAGVKYHLVSKYSKKGLNRAFMSKINMCLNGVGYELSLSNSRFDIIIEKVIKDLLRNKVCNMSELSRKLGIDWKTLRRIEDKGLYSLNFNSFMKVINKFKLIPKVTKIKN
jgi:hypothetical protein